MNNNYRSPPLRKRKEDWTFSPGFEGGSCCKVKPKTAADTYNAIPHKRVKSSTQRRTDISPKLLKHHPSPRFHQQNRDQSESSGTDMTGAAATPLRTIISSEHSKQRPSGRIHNQDRYESFGTDMTFAATTPQRTFISPKKSKYSPSGHIRQQNGQRIESSDTDLSQKNQINVH